MMLPTIQFDARFLALLDELDHYQLPPRRRLRPGEDVAAKAFASVVISGRATGAVAPPPRRGSILANVVIGGKIRVGDLRFSEAAKRKRIGKNQIHRSRIKTPKPPKPPKIVAPRLPRSAEAIASASAKVRQQREARVAAILPLVEDARANGCLLLSEICQYLDSIGHKPQQGARWSVGTLSQMLPPVTAQDRQARDYRFAALIAEARADGAIRNEDIADWLNARSIRTARGTAWVSDNVARFRRETEDRGSLVERLTGLFADALADGANTNQEVANWLNARGIVTVDGKQWKPANVGYFRRGKM